MLKNNLRKRAKISYYEPEEHDLDEYIFCTECGDYVVEYCAVHGALLIIPDTKVSIDSTSSPLIPRAALTIPDVFLHIAPSIIPGAGLGVFTTLTLPSDVRFGPYTGDVKSHITSPYCWQIYTGKRALSHVVDALDPNRSNWMRYVNCSRHWNEQNLLAYQYRGEIYYRTLKIIPRNTELLVYYGTEYARELGIDIRGYNDPKKYVNYITRTAAKDNAAETASFSNEDLQEDPTNSLHEEEQNSQEEIIKINFENDTVTFEEVSNNQFNLQENIPNYAHNDPTSITSKHLEQITDDSTIDNTDLFDLYSNFNENQLKNSEDNFNNKNTYDQYKINHTKNSDLNNHIIQDIEEYNNNSIYKLTDKGYFQCQRCNKHTYSEACIQQHIRLHDPNRRYECYICHYKYVNGRRLKRHIDNVHLDRGNHQCTLCNIIYSKLSCLKKHLANHHNNFGNNRYNIDDNNNFVANIHNLNVNSNNIQQNMILCSSKVDKECELIDKENMQNNCTSHIKMNDDQNYKSRDLISNENLDKFEPNHAESFSNDNIKNDQNYYTTDNLYVKCNICGYKTTSKHHIHRHILLHDGRRPFSCSLCQFRFSERKSLTRHLNTVHKAENCVGVRNFKTAPILGPINTPKDTEIANTFDDKYDSNQHSIVITENEDEKENMKNKDTVTEVFNKEEITKLTVNSIDENNLKYTVNVDMSFQCLDCDYNTPSDFAIKMHVNFHDSRRRQVCHICNYRFKTGHRLRNHISGVHYNEKPWKCSFCEWKYASVSSLRRHLESVHKC